MATRKSMTILTITSEAETRVGRPLLDGGDAVLCEAHAEPLEQAAFAPVLRKAHLVAVKLFHLRGHMSDPVHKTQLYRALAQPELAGEQIVVLRQFIAPSRGDLRLEHLVHLFENVLEATHIFVLLRQEGIEEGSTQM